jgi:uncharacterized protein (DUF1778 family)
MLETACRQAEAVLLDYRVFVLDEEKYQQFGLRSLSISTIPLEPSIRTR